MQVAEDENSGLLEGLGEKDKWVNHRTWPLEKSREQVWKRGREKLKNSTSIEVPLYLRAAELEQNSSLKI